MHERDPERPDPGKPSRQEVRETLIERQIREAMEDGRFDDLPHVGRRLPIEDDSAAGDWAMAYRMLRSAGAAPPWVEADKAAREALERLDRVLEHARHASPVSHGRLRADLQAHVTAANRAIERLNSEAPTDRQHRRLVDGAAMAQRLEDILRAGG